MAYGGETPEPPAKRQRKSNSACRRCHTYKIKCSGEQPCQNCSKSTTAVACVYPSKDRNIQVKQSYVEQLEAEIAELRQKLSSENGEVPDSGSNNGSSPSKHTREAINPNVLLSKDVPKADPPPDTDNIEESLDFTEETALDMSRPLHVQFVKDGQDNSLSAYVGEAASEAFGTRVLQYLKGDETIAPPMHDRYFKNKGLLRLSNTAFQLPERGYAVLLVDVAERMVGAEYHMFLRRPFMRELDEMYNSMTSSDPVRLCGMFAIFALGEMYSSPNIKSDPTSNIPGTAFFVQAMGLFQDLYEEPSIPYIEVVLLLSYYSHALNRRNTVYVLTGLALRLSLTLGLHRDTPDQLATELEREHRRRVWWTVYTLDRHSSLKLGHPVMIRDEDVDVKMPSVDHLTAEEQEDLPNPQQLIANISLAKIAGQILQQLYCVSKPSIGSSSLKSVQRILLSLRSFAEGLPDELKLERIIPTACPGRALASLHVYFNHCIILTTRPIFFYVFRCGVAPSTGITSPRPTISSLTLALSEACVQAATASHNLLRTLWINGLITILGGFDSHYLFSATLILTIANAMKPSEATHNVLESCSTMLNTMGNNGNLSAKGYYEQISQLKLNLEEASIVNQASFSKNVHVRSELSNFQTLQATHEHAGLRNTLPRTDIDFGFYQDDLTLTANILNNPDINDFLAYMTDNSVGSDGFDGFSRAWDMSWNEQPLPLNFS